MTVHLLKLAGRKAPKLMDNVMVPRSERNDRAPVDHQKLSIGDRLGREGVHLAGLQTEDVAGHVEGSNLPSTFAQGFVNAHRPADHPVEIIGRTIFAVDLAVARNPY